MIYPLLNDLAHLIYTYFTLLFDTILLIVHHLSRYSLRSYDSLMVHTRMISYNLSYNLLVSISEDDATQKKLITICYLQIRLQNRTLFLTELGACPSFRLLCVYFFALCGILKNTRRWPQAKTTINYFVLHLFLLSFQDSFLERNSVNILQIAEHQDNVRTFFYLVFF